MTIRTPDGRRLTRAEALQHIRVERMQLERERLELRRLIAQKQRDLTAIEDRLSDLDHATGLLGGDA